MDTDKPLDVLARNSLEPVIALSNGKPTIIEFYADWCEVCQEMAPSMLNFKDKYENKIDVVLLNVDNDQWTDLYNKYEVSGIPQLNLFDKLGLIKGKFVGFKNENQLNQIADYLLSEESITNLIEKENNDKSSFSNLPYKKESDAKIINPMSHS